MKEISTLGSGAFIMIALALVAIVTPSCSGGENSKEAQAWEAMCQAVRVRVKFPSEAVFPPMPAVEQSYASSSLVGYYAENVKGLQLKRNDIESGGEEYYRWLGEILERVEMHNEGEEWIIAGWVDTPNAMGVKSRIPWFGAVREAPGSQDFEVEKVEFLDFVQ